MSFLWGVSRTFGNAALHCDLNNLALPLQNVVKDNNMGPGLIARLCAPIWAECAKPRARTIPDPFKVRLSLMYLVKESCAYVRYFMQVQP